MSAVPTQDVSSAAPRMTAEAAGQQLIGHLRKTAQFIKILDMVTLMAVCLVGLLAIWLVGSIVDHWLVALPVLARWTIWGLTVGCLGWLLATRMLPLVFRRINPVYAANRIEQLMPEFQNGLITWLEVQALPQLGVPKGVQAALSFRAIRFLGGQDPASTVDSGPLIRLVGAVLLLVVALTVYAVLSPKSLMESGKRLAMPWLKISAPTRVQILGVSPGDVELTYGSPLQVEVDLRGLSSRDSAVVRMDSLDGQIVNRRISLGTLVEGLRYSASIGTDGRGLEHEVEYWIEAGDAVSGPFRVELNPLPALTVQRIQVQYPEYTGLPPKEYAPSVPVDAVEGSMMQIWGTTNQRLDRAKLVMNPELDAQGTVVRATEYIDMRVGAKELEGIAKLNLNHKAFCLRGNNPRGDSNRHPVLHPITVSTDLPPEVVLVGPESRVVRAGPNSRLTLEVRANDADFGLHEIQLELSPTQQPKISKTLFKFDETNPASVLSRVFSVPLNLSALQVKPGDRIEVVATAADTRHDPVTGSLSSNQTRSTPLVLEIVAPAAEAIPPEMKRPASSPDQPDNPANDPPTTRSPPDSSSPSSKPPSERKQSEGGQSAQEPEQDKPSQTKDEGSQPPKDQAANEGSGQGGASSSEQSGSQNAQSSSDNRSAGGESGTGDQSPSQLGSQSKGSQPQAGQPDGGQESVSSSTSPNEGQTPAGSGKSQSGDLNSEYSPAQQAADQEALRKVREYMEKQQPKSGQGLQASDAKPQEAKGESSNPQLNGGSQQTGEPNGDNGRNQGVDGQNDRTGSEDGAGSDVGQGADNSQGSDKRLGTKERGSREGKEQVGQPADEKPAQQGSRQSDQQRSESNGEASDQQPSEPNSKAGDQNRGQQRGESSGESGGESGSPPSGEKNSEKGGQQSGQEGDSKAPGEGSPEGSSPEGSSLEGSSAEGDSAEGDSAERASSDSSGGDQTDSKSQAPKNPSGGDQDGSKASNQAGATSGSQAGSQSSSQDGQNASSEASDQGGQQNADNLDTPSGSQSGKSGANGKSGQSGSSEDSKSGSSSDSPSGGSPGSGQTSSGGSSSGPGIETGAGTGEATDPRFALQSTDLTLDYLRRQREQPDPDLLREMDWTSKDLADFLDRYQSAKNMSAEAAPLDDQEEQLGELNIGPSDRRGLGPSGRKDEFRNQLDSGGRVRPPERLRKQIEAFQEALRQGNPR